MWEMRLRWASPVVKKNKQTLPANVGDMGSILGQGRSPGEGNGNPLQYFCLENPMDRGAWRATVRRVPKTTERLSTAQRQGAACDMSQTNTAPPLLLQNSNISILTVLCFISDKK